MSIAFHGTKITPAVETMIRQRGVGGLVLHAENADDAAGLTKLTADLQVELQRLFDAAQAKVDGGRR